MKQREEPAVLALQENVKKHSFVKSPHSKKNSYQNPASFLHKNSLLSKEKTVGALLSDGLHSLLTLLYPLRCPICENIPPSRQNICPSCYQQLSFVEQPYCYSCGKPLTAMDQEYCYDCIANPKSFSRGFALLVYDKSTKSSMSAIKYRNRRQFLSFYVNLTIERYGNFFSSCQFDCILPVPIHPKRRKKRGYNQAALFASSLGKQLGIPVYDSVIIRRLNTIPLKTLSPQKRLEHLQKAFSIHPQLEGISLPFYRILLVDDIYTTGATMEAITRILKEAGVTEVYIFSICIGQGY